MNVNRSSEILSENRHQQQKKGPEGSRVAQLEQNIKFLQEQHQLMLTGLHKEIDSLRLRNRGEFNRNQSKYLVIGSRQLRSRLF